MNPLSNAFGKLGMFCLHCSVTFLAASGPQRNRNINKRMYWIAVDQDLLEFCENNILSALQVSI